MAEDLAKSIVEAAKALDAHDKQKLIAIICRPIHATDEHFVQDEDEDRLTFRTFVGAYNYLARKGFVVATESFDSKIRKCFDQKVSSSSPRKNAPWALVCVMEKQLTEEQRQQHMEEMNGIGSA